MTVSNTLSWLQKKNSPSTLSYLIFFIQASRLWYFVFRKFPCLRKLNLQKNSFPPLHLIEVRFTIVWNFSWNCIKRAPVNMKRAHRFLHPTSFNVIMRTRKSSLILPQGAHPEERICWGARILRRAYLEERASWGEGVLRGADLEEGASWGERILRRSQLEVNALIQRVTPPCWPT